VVANFSASWCGPCRVISPVYAEMSQTYPQLMFLTIDVDELMVINVLSLSLRKWSQPCGYMYILSPWIHKTCTQYFGADSLMSRMSSSEMK